MGICQKICDSDVDAIRQTLELIDPEKIRRAADILVSAGRVLCMGQGASMILAQECAHLFSLVRPNFYAVIDSHIQAIAASQLTARDVVLYFSYSGSTKELLDNLKIVREQRAMSILITRFPKSPGAAYADVVLQCGGAPAGRVDCCTYCTVISCGCSFQRDLPQRCRRKYPASGAGGGSTFG